MLNTTEDERQSIVDYLASQAPSETVQLLQKVYTERVMGVTHSVWDVHTDKERSWVITEPTNLYSQQQFPNMDLALTFHVGLCLRIPHSERKPLLTDLQVEPLLGCWRAIEQAQDAMTTAQELEDFQAIGVRCREALLTLVHAIQDAIEAPHATVDLKRSDFKGWSDVIVDVVLAGSTQKARRSLLKTSAKAAWDFVNWLTHARSAHVNDAEAGLSATEQVLSLFTTACIRHLRGVPASCPVCGSQRIVPERGVHTSVPDKTFERPVCTVCNWAGSPVEVQVAVRLRVPPLPEGDCVIMEVPLSGPEPPKPSAGRSH